MRQWIFAVSCLAVMGCTEQPMIARDTLDVSGPSYRLNVANITVTHDYISPKRPPNVEHLADITPIDTVKKWAAERLQAAGSVNTLEVDIKDASIVHTELPKQKTGIEGAFTTEQTEQYEGRLEVEIKIYSPQSPLAMAHIEASATQRLTLPDNAAPIEKERAIHNISVDMMNTLKLKLDDEIHAHFNNYIM